MFFLFSRLRTRVPLLSEAWFWGLFCIALLSFKNILILYWVLVAQTKKGSACKSRKPRFDPWAGKICWRRKWTPTPVFLPRESHGQRRLVSYSPWGCKESDTTKRLINTHTHHWWTILCLFQAYSKMIQSYIFNYLFFFKFLSHLGYCIILSRVPCAMQSVLVGYIF